MTFRSLPLGSLFLVLLPITLSAQITVDQPIPTAASAAVDYSGSSLALFCVNRSLDTDITSAVVIAIGPSAS
jgi:hypothetical protein